MKIAAIRILTPGFAAKRLIPPEPKRKVRPNPRSVKVRIDPQGIEGGIPERLTTRHGLTFGEVGDGDGDHGENARREERQRSHAHGKDDVAQSLHRNSVRAPGRSRGTRGGIRGLFLDNGRRRLRCCFCIGGNTFSRRPTLPDLHGGFQHLVSGRQAESIAAHHEADLHPSVSAPGSVEERTRPGR